MKFVLDVWNVIDWVVDPKRHILVSLVVGLVMYYLTSSIALAQLWGLEKFAHKKIKGGVILVVCALCALVGLGALIWTHHELVYIWGLYSAPKNPPLHLVTPTPRAPLGNT